MASISLLPFSSFAFASLLFLSTLICLSHASIEQPSSIEHPVSEPDPDRPSAAPLSPHFDTLLVSEPFPKMLDSETLADIPSPTPLSLHSDTLPVSEPLSKMLDSETLADIPSATPLSLHSDTLPVSEPLSKMLDSEILAASMQEEGSIPTSSAPSPSPDESCGDDSPCPQPPTSRKLKF
ncbi:hypothetical protein FCV25MIE_08324 [Fagus crenata]